jgi:cholesterol transport system auxiliary component
MNARTVVRCGGAGGSARAAVAGALVGALSCAGLAGCGSLFGPPPPAPHYWVLDAATRAGGAPNANGIVPAVPAAPAASSPSPASVIVVAMPRAAAGYDTDRIVYAREPHRLEPYAENQWIDTPPRMLMPLIAESLARTGVFGAVLNTPAPAEGAWRLETTIVRLQHEVPEARVVFTLRATLVDQPHRRVVAAREFEAVAPTPSTNPAGAVAAANTVAADVLKQLADWCAAFARTPGPPGP